MFASVKKISLKQALILRVIVKVFKKIDAFKNKFMVVLLYRNERLCLDV